MDSESYPMNILKFFSLLDVQNGQFRLLITIHDSDMRGLCMEYFGYYIPSQYFMGVGGDSLVGLKCYIRFDTVVVCQGYQMGSGWGNCVCVHYNNSKGENNLAQIILQIKVYFGDMLFRKQVLMKSSHRIETHLDMIV